MVIIYFIVKKDYDKKEKVNYLIIIIMLGKIP